MPARQVPSTGGRPEERGARGSAVRADIQALRAVAVAMVVLYHFWPHRLTGGFTGVDVFLVISGFLITSHLLAHPPRRMGDLLAFWSRRIRRLLPASLLVLLVTLVGSRLVSPETTWAATAAHVKAAALYVVNWRLADDSVDYLASQSAPTPVQHFWSLSVEEQFYFFWPVLLLLLVAIARSVRRGPRAIVAAGVTLVVVLSLGYSIVETAAEPARAYFVTPTRIWELGAGGLLAALSVRAHGRRGLLDGTRLPVPVRTGLAWLGWATIAGTAVAFTGSLPFPSWTAAVPVVGAAAVIWADASSGAWSPARMTALRPVQGLGNISYSVYLWHWPLLVLVPSALGHPLTTMDKVVVIAVALGLAFLTKRYIEDRFRAPGWARPVWKPYALAAAAMVLVVGAGQLQLLEVDHRATVARQELAAHLSGSTPCFGAAALAAPAGTCPERRSGPLYPAAGEAAADKSAVWDLHGGRDCFAHPPSFQVTTCSTGPAGSPVRVALVGNSHAGEWYSALQAIAQQEHWRVTTFIASQCALAELPQDLDTPAHSASCAAWGRQVIDRVVRGRFDLVVMSDRVSVPAIGRDKASSLPLYEQGYVKVLEAFSAAHLPVAVLRDTPAPGDGGLQSVPDCLASHQDDYGACAGPRSTWLPADPTVAAVRHVADPLQQVIDLTDRICGPTRCAGAVGEVPVYFDGSHLTATYAHTLAPYLAPRLLDVLKG
jgi:peptidoglycan/LPS O-acetylase OafA/YrhL